MTAQMEGKQQAAVSSENVDNAEFVLGYVAESIRSALEHPSLPFSQDTLRRAYELIELRRSRRLERIAASIAAQAAQ